MRPVASPSNLLSAVAPRRAAHGFGGSGTGRKKRTKHLYERMDADGRERPEFKSHFVSAPKLESAYPMPKDLPPVPLHIEQLSGRRLNWYERTMQEDKLSKDDLDVLQKAMDRHKKPERPTVEFESGQNGPSEERMAFFQDPEMAVAGEVVPGDEIPGIEVGRVVEIRRSGMMFTGLVLAPILVAGRSRILLLRSSGEIWPISPNDVQFVMPASLIRPGDAELCWHPDLLKLWASGQDIGLASTEQELSTISESELDRMAEARRKVATVLRKVQRATERMEARLSGGTLKNGRGGGIEAVWDKFVPSDPEARGSVTSSEVAEYLLNADGAGEEGTPRVSVRPSTLPAFSAHTLLMRRPDLFLADDRQMWASGTFLVRSRNERDRFTKVTELVEADDPALDAFVKKAKKIKAALKNGSSDLPEWTELEKDIISVLLIPFYEQRSTQRREDTSVIAAIAKMFDEEESGALLSKIDVGVVAEILRDIGVLPHTDSLRTSTFKEAISRSFVMNKTESDAGEALQQPTAADAALDSIRSDFSHRVFVIDSETAEELDDGVAVERVGEDDFWIHVHVADPTRFIERDGALSNHASFYGSSMYLPEGTVPLLPNGVSSSLGAASGSRGQETMVFSTRVDRAGNISDYKVAMGNLKSAVVTTYADVNKALNIETGHINRPFGFRARDRLTDTSPEKVPTTLSADDTADLQLLRELSDAIRAKRFAKGGLEWWLGHDSEIKVHNSEILPNIFDRTLFPSAPKSYTAPEYSYSVTPQSPTTSSQSIVSELMVLANRTAAHFCHEHGIPVPFRGMGMPSETSSTPAHLTVEKLLASRKPGTGYVSGIDMQISNLLFPPVVVDTVPSAYWIMGFGQADHGYLRATSPLRRYDDMLVHWQIKAALGKAAGLESQPLEADEVLRRVNRSDAAQQRIKTIQRQSVAYWQAGLFADRLTGPLPSGYVYGLNDKAVDLTEPLSATVFGPTISSPRVDRTVVSVPALGTEVDLETKDMTFEIGQKLRIRVTKTQQWPNPGLSAVLV